jgi:hypothetical protein
VQVHASSPSSSSESNIQLVKSVLYQCNSCLFQTDKKVIMNRHSRVHLPQKRKAMEELQTPINITTLNVLKNDQTTPPPPKTPPPPPSTIRLTNSNDNQHNKSYCKDCDIQFSSINTYQHHRNNYCQKYKTIEAVVPIESTSTMNSKNIIKKSQKSNENLNSKHQNNTQNDGEQLTVNPLIQLNSRRENSPLLNDITKGLPMNAVRMGNLVYVPVYKLNDDVKIEDNDPKPLDLSKKGERNSKYYSKEEEMEEEDEEEDDENDNLNIKCDLCQMNLPTLEIYYLHKLYYCSKNRNKLIMPKISNHFGDINDFNFDKVQHKRLFNFKNKKINKEIEEEVEETISTTAITDSIQFSIKNENKNKILNCQNCGNFFKFKELKQHHIICNNTKQINNSTSQSQINIRNNQNLNPHLLQHPLVKKTLEETYSRSFYNNLYSIDNNDDNQKHNNNQSSPLIQQHFYICTTCGYRGNTARGVKQHGKLHLSNSEHFAILNIDTRVESDNNEPSFIYYSMQDCDLNEMKMAPIVTSPSIDQHSKEIVLNSQLKQSINDDKINKINNNNSSNRLGPISKKARLLDSHYQQQRQMLSNNNSDFNKSDGNSDKNTNNNDDDDDENDDGELSNLKNYIKVQKSQTFCFKCGIQFQHVKNFLAHKKLYCKNNSD